MACIPHGRHEEDSEVLYDDRSELSDCVSSPFDPDSDSEYSDSDSSAELGADSATSATAPDVLDFLSCLSLLDLPRGVPLGVPLGVPFGVPCGVFLPLLRLRERSRP